MSKPRKSGPKFIVVTGGVLSGLGKGIASASIGNLLSGRLKVIPVKCDGYLNTDPGTMNPIEHGEVPIELGLNAHEALVVAEVHVHFAAVVLDEHLAVLDGVHGAGIGVQVAVALDRDDLEAARQQVADGSRGNAFPQPREHASRDDYILAARFPGLGHEIPWPGPKGGK